MKNKIFTIIASIISLAVWLLDASAHYYIYKEPVFEFIPKDIDELLMRTLIIILIIMLGIFADFFSKKIMLKQKQLEAANIYNSMLYANHHILNNLLNQMQLFKMEAIKCKDFDKDVIKLYDVIIEEASELIARLSGIEDITEGNIMESISPQKPPLQPIKQKSSGIVT